MVTECCVDGAAMQRKAPKSTFFFGCSAQQLLTNLTADDFHLLGLTV
jgi:hypothetical protein